MKKIELTIESLEIKGTSKWVAEEISKMELRIINDGCFKIQCREKTKEGNKIWKTVVKTKSCYPGLSPYQNYDEMLESTWECENTENRPQDYEVPTLFSTLTPSAEAYAWKFVQKCAKALREFINQDEELDIDFEIIKNNP